MAATLKLVALLSLFTIGSLAQSLLTVLRQEGFSEFAAILERSGINITQNVLVYAPTDAAIQRRRLPGGLLARGEADNTAEAKATAEYSLFPKPEGDLEYKRTSVCSDVVGPGAVDYMSFLSDPEYVNLPPGNNASIVQKNVLNAGLPVVFSGLGDSVKVTGLDIPFDHGSIRPVSEFLTLPRLLSYTLPFIAADKTLAVLNQTGLLGQFDTVPGVTFLAPDDRAYPADLPTEVLAEILRRHLIVGLPIFTSDLKHGDSYKTLAGTTVTVTVQCGNVFIGGARILAGDAIVKNGVVHTVNKLLDAPVFITKTQVQTLTETRTQTTQVVQTVQTVTTETVEAVRATTLTQYETETIHLDPSTTETVTRSTTIVHEAPPLPPTTVTQLTTHHPPPVPPTTITSIHHPPPPTVHPPPLLSVSTPCTTSKFWTAAHPTTLSKVTKHTSEPPKHYTKEH
ncbi:hypothetical protein OQA88_11563 [Cercophora sp. LCS_1]